MAEHDEFAGRPGSDNELPEQPQSDIPEITRRTRTNRVVTVGGYAVLTLLTIFLLIWINRGSFEKKAPVVETTTRTRPPPINIPALELEEPSLAEVARERARAVEQDKEDVSAVWLRKMAGGVVSGSGSRGSSGSSGASGSGGQASRMKDKDDAQARFLDALTAANAAGNAGEEAPAIASKGRLADELEPTETAAVKAGVLANRNFVIAKGTAIDCVLETAIDSTVPGMTTCQVTRDIYSDNGKVLLIDKGTQLVGEYRGDVKRGEARMFMLWTRAKTPNGVVVELDSPATDELGRGGVDGYVENFFWKRFGAAILMTMFSDTVDYAVARQKRGGNDINYTNTGRAGARVVDSMLQQQANIAPRLTRNQGTRVQVMVARDLDFSDVYGLRIR